MESRKLKNFKKLRDSLPLKRKYSNFINFLFIQFQENWNKFWKWALQCRHWDTYVDISSDEKDPNTCIWSIRCSACHKRARIQYKGKWYC